MMSESADLLGGIAAAALWMGRSAVARKPVPLPPMLTHCANRSRHVCATVEYSDNLRLDIWRPAKATAAPVFVFVPGGGWILGQRRPQGYALMSRLVEQGWICVAIDYRVAPRHRWPMPFVDVKKAYSWVLDNIADYQGDPQSVAIGGASAGAHLSALMGLTQTGRRKPRAVVGLYGSYDWEGRDTLYRRAFMRFLERVVVGRLQKSGPHIFSEASPMRRVTPDAPPFLLIHGTSDRLCPVSEARRFNSILRAVSTSPMEYCEIEGAAHGFDLLHPEQTAIAVDRACRFLAAAVSHK